ncbi:T9SS type A sorting domain-containing protein [Limibacter armeniacum]|uniref:T9SS type A sorting domain-containing protein n=1 Tax=Limibacter armeniacum TaxID=466084 RepID=UPI002FE5D159
MKKTQKLTLVMLLSIFFAVSLYAQRVPDLPAEISGKYYSYINTNRSDDFEGASLNSSKWLRREATNQTNKRITEDPSFIVLSNGTLICKGKDNTAGGIVSKNSMKYGFYMVRWKLSGFSPTRKSSYHPSIWSANCNGYNGPERTCLSGSNWTEIDLIEVTNYGGGARTQADAPCRINGTKINDPAANGSLGEKAIMKSFYDFDIDTDWHIYGLEYNWNYMQVWRYVNGEWLKLGRQVVFNSSSTGSISSIPKVCRSDMFWYIGNLWTGGGDSNEPDVTKLVVDYFRLYQVKSGATFASSFVGPEINELNLNRFKFDPTDAFEYDENMKFSGLSISQGTLRIEGLNYEDAHVLIYSMNGALVYDGYNYFKKGKLSLDVSAYKNGVYVLKIIEPHQTITRKFLIKK